MVKFLIILNMILSLKFEKYQKSNGEVVWFDCPNFYVGATRYMVT